MDKTQPPIPCESPRSIVTVEIYSEGMLRQRLTFIGKQRITFGRGENSDVRFSSSEQAVSSIHAELVCTPNGLVLRDAASRNGLFLRCGSELVRQREMTLEPAAPAIELSFGSPGPLCRISLGHVYPFAEHLVTGQLGEGGMARVFAAQDASGLSRLVVLKIIAPRFLLSVDECDAEAMLIEEARILSLVSHSNVVKIFGVGSFEGTPYIQMEYLQGVNLGSLQEQLAQRGARCTFELAAALISQACHGLHAAHEARDAGGKPLEIIHRDFSPQNIMCSPEGDVKLIDFGVARALGRRPFTTGSLFVGKAAYASPEQISRPSLIDRRSDLFAAGVILYELVAGTPLFDRGSDYWTMNAVMHDPVPALPGVPDVFNELLARVLAKDPEARPRSAEILAEELEQLVLQFGQSYLKRKNIAQGLQRLGVCLDAPPPRALRSRPTVFPRARRPALATPPADAVRADRSMPPVPRPKKVLSWTPQPARPAAAELPALPLQINVDGLRLSCDRRLHDDAQPNQDHVILLATPLDRPIAEGESLQVHLIGERMGRGPLRGPQRAQLDAFVDTLRRQAPSLSPFVGLQSYGEALPGGAQALVFRRPARSFADALSRTTGRCPDPLALCLSLVRCLCRADQLFPGFTHGALSPREVPLGKDAGADPHLLVGPCLDWLFGTPPQPGCSLEELPLHRALYLAPELLFGVPPSPASDIFSISMMAYELLGGNSTAATWALRQNGRLPQLPQGSPATPAVREALAAGLKADPARRPRVRELLRLWEASVVTSNLERSGAVELRAPPPGEVTTASHGEGRTVHLHTLRLDGQRRRGPVPLPFANIPQLLPAGIGLSCFREALAVELLSSCEGDPLRPRIYSDRSHAGATRLFLTAGGGSFEIGSRSQNRLQRIEYQVLPEPGATLPAISAQNLRVLSEELSCVALLWTREPSSGDLHACCVQLGE